MFLVAFIGCSDSGDSPQQFCFEPLSLSEATDGDADGVSDRYDVCPGYLDQADADGDGIPDGCDLCPEFDDLADQDGDGLPDSCDKDPAHSDWARVATVGGLSTWSDATKQEISTGLDALASQGVTVVEADSSLSSYLSDEEFELELELMRRTALLARERDMRVVWYYPTMEVVSEDGRVSPSSMFKDHPEWVQVSIGPSATPNVFYGDLAFWVEPNDESAWLDPLTGYRDYFLQRVRKIAATGIDGIWFDVPLLNEIVGRWTSHTPESRFAFREATGLEAPTDTDPDDPAWWMWVQWRHRMIADFLADLHRVAREVNPSIEIIIENVTLDYISAMLQGLDGAYSDPGEGFGFVWEVDVTVESKGMVFAQPDDWISLISMMKFGRGVDPHATSWAFVYGNDVDDAEMVMAEAIATQNNPYELKAPEMMTTVSPCYRQRVFSWINRNRDLLFRSRSMARVAVLHSSASRDFVDGTCLLDGTCSVGLYATTDRPWRLGRGETWWARGSLEVDSLYATLYQAEFRGLVKAMVNLHRPFDVLPIRRATADRLARYDALLVPDLQAVSQVEAERLRAYAEAGGHVLFTGPAPGQRSNLAATLANNALASLLPSKVEHGTCSRRTVGAGDILYCNSRLGRTYVNHGDPVAREIVEKFLTEAMDRLIDTTAPNETHFELYRRGDRQVLHAVNFVGARGWVEVVPQTFRVSVDVSSMPGVSRVVATSPRGTSVVPFTQIDERVEFEASVDVHNTFVITP